MSAEHQLAALGDFLDVQQVNQVRSYLNRGYNLVQALEKLSNNPYVKSSFNSLKRKIREGIDSALQPSPKRMAPHGRLGSAFWKLYTKEAAGHSQQPRAKSLNAHGTVHSSTQLTRRVRRRRRRSALKGKPLPKRVRALERRFAEGQGRVTEQFLFNGRLQPAPIGLSSDPVGCFLVMHEAVAIRNACTGTSTSSTNSLVRFGAINTTNPTINLHKLPYVDLDAANPTQLKLIERSPFERNANLGGTSSTPGETTQKDFVLWDDIGTHVELVLYNAHAYPVMVQINDFRPKEAETFNPGQLAAEDVQSNTLLKGDPNYDLSVTPVNQDQGVSLKDAGWWAPYRNVYHTSSVSRHYSHTHKTYEIPAGQTLTLRFSTHCRKFNLKKTDEENQGKLSTFVALGSPSYGTRYVSFRCWGALGSNTTGGGAFNMPVDRVEYTAKCTVNVKYKAGGHQTVRRNYWEDQRDLTGTPAVTAADTGAANEDTGKL